MSEGPPAPSDTGAVSRADKLTYVDWSRDPDGHPQVSAARFEVRRLLPGADGGGHNCHCDEETILILPEPGAVYSNRDRHLLPGRSVVILPPGPGRISVAEGTAAYLIAPVSAGQVQLTDRWERRSQQSAELPALRIFEVDHFAAPPDNPRLKMFQSTALSINWAEYEGPRDRRKLSPHAHDDFEQGALVLSGAFIHHLRLPWESDSTSWIADRHLVAAAPSLLIIPPKVIHTSEGVGPGRHLLIDIFSPPRADFRARGWMANAEDYLAPHP